MRQTITFLLFWTAIITSMAQTPLAYGFDHPQDTARTKVWWFHGETVGTHEGITADLEAFKRQGVGGVVYYDQVHGDGEGAFDVFSPEWWDELLFSSQEARRLGLSFEVNCSNGYVAGGKWITPDRSMQSLVCTEKIVEGGCDLTFQMPLPEKMPGGWHHDVAIIALPYQEALLEQVLMPELAIDFPQPFTARSITYEVSARGKARTSSMQVPPSHFNLDSRPKEFFGCGFTPLPPVAELQASQDGVSFYKVCDLRPRYRNLGGIKLQTVAFPKVTARRFRIVPTDTTVTFNHITLSARASVDAWQQKASLISEFIDADRVQQSTDWVQQYSGETKQYPNETTQYPGQATQSANQTLPYPGSQSYPPEDLADFSQAIDLTSMLAADGTVSWQKAPQGKWLVLRFLSVSNGGHTKHGRKEALGLECDKLSVEGIRLHWQSYVKPVIDSIRAHGGVLQGICMDSHEAGPQNWTVGFENEFLRLRGYDMRKYIPVMAGFVVGSVEESDRFLYDLRRTISDLITDRYYGEMNRLCHAEQQIGDATSGACLTLTAQAVGGALCMAGDAIEVKKLLDKPQAEFWAYQTEGNYDIKDCSSSAHLYGKLIASGEAFTDATYKHTLADIKNLADYAYSFGINELVVCAVAYQPWLDNRLNTAHGRQYVLNRKNTLWPMSRPFWDYQARCSWMMRQGQPVSSLCLYLGDDVPMRILSHRLPDLPQGYDFDAFTTDALLHRMVAKDGRIALPNGINYRMMILPPDGQITLKAQQQIDLLRQQGAVIYDPQTDHRTLAEAIHDAGIRPDVETPHGEPLYFAHRQTDDEDIYFLNNHSDQPIRGLFTFATTADVAELWHPVSGERWRLAMVASADRPGGTSLCTSESCPQETWTGQLGTIADGRSTVQLHMAPRESFFIVFNHKDKEQPAHGRKGKHPIKCTLQNAPDKQKTATWTIPVIPSEWSVSFDAKIGGPTEAIRMQELGDWTQSDDPRIKFFSGTAVCKASFKMASYNHRYSYRLNLPLLNTAAEVLINGQSAGIVWCSPWTVDVSRQLRRGTNHIELRIVNCLWNRLVGDALLPESERIIRQNYPLAKPTDSLVPSGILGGMGIITFRDATM